MISLTVCIPISKRVVLRLKKKKNLGYIISGDYDFGNGEWANSYIVTDLLATSMIWTIKDTPSDIQKFERCDRVPEEIENEVRDF